MRRKDLQVKRLQRECELHSRWSGRLMILVTEEIELGWKKNEGRGKMEECMSEKMVE